MNITRKMVPITGRASSFLVFLEFSKTGGNTKKIKQNDQLTQGYTLIFIIHNINTILLYIHILIGIVNFI